MKRTLYLVRHAKSSWDDPSLDDFERPLNERGKRDAPRMAKRMKERDIVPDLLYSSPATRAIKTCKEFAKVLGIKTSAVNTDDQLYHASEETLLSRVHGLKDQLDTVMLFGHNPGLTDFANLLTGEQILNIPTAGVVGIRFKADRWRDVRAGTGKLLFFDFPKKNTKD